MKSNSINIILKLIQYFLIIKIEIIKKITTVYCSKMPNIQDIVFLANLINIDTKDPNNIFLKDKILDYLLSNVKYFPGNKYLITNLTNLMELSDDEIITIQSYIPIYQNLKISTTNKRIYSLLNTNYIWNYLIRRDFVLLKHQFEESFNKYSDYKFLYQHLYEKNKILTYLLDKYSGCPITSVSLDLLHKYIGYNPCFLDIIFDIHNDYNGIQSVISVYDIILVFDFLKTISDSDNNSNNNSNNRDHEYFMEMQKGREDHVRSLQLLIKNVSHFNPDNFDLLINLFNNNSHDIKDIMNNYLSSHCIIYFYVSEDNSNIIYKSCLHTVNYDKSDILLQYFSYLDHILLHGTISKTLDPIVINIYNTYRDNFYKFEKDLISNFTIDTL